MSSLKQNVHQLHQKYSHLTGVSFFILGFFFDLLTLGRIDDVLNIIFQAIYLVICYLILVSFKLEEKEYENKFVSTFMEYRNEIFHFLIGSLLSAFTIFYFKSSSFSTSFIFLIVLALLLVLNEFEVVQKLGITVKSLLLKICSLTFLIYLLPVIFATNSRWLFYLALILSIGLSFGIKNIFEKKLTLPKETVDKEFFYPRMLVIVFFALMYITNILPPLPLHLSYVGVFHKIEKQYPEYLLYHENPWWRFWQHADEQFQAKEGDFVNVFFKVFSPGGFKGQVWVEWYWYNDQASEWQRSDRIPVSIEGGRDTGYRGFITKKNYQPGQWEVIIKTDNDLILGKNQFTINLDSGTHEREFRKIIDL